MEQQQNELAVLAQGSRWSWQQHAAARGQQLHSRVRPHLQRRHAVGGGKDGSHREAVLEEQHSSELGF